MDTGCPTVNISYQTDGYRVSRSKHLISDRWIQGVPRSHSNHLISQYIFMPYTVVGRYPIQPWIWSQPPTRTYFSHFVKIEAILFFFLIQSMTYTFTSRLFSVILTLTFVTSFVVVSFWTNASVELFCKPDRSILRKHWQIDMCQIKQIAQFKLFFQNMYLL